MRARQPARWWGDAASPGSAMTALEELGYWEPLALDVGSGYPRRAGGKWVEHYQANPAEGYLDVPPAEYAEVIRGWFTRHFGPRDVHLVPTATMATAIVVQAVMQRDRARAGQAGARSQVVIFGTSFEPYPRLLESLGADVVFAGRDDDGYPDAGQAAAACTARTVAILVVSPDNPLGKVCPQGVLEQLAATCRRRGITLIADHVLALISPWGTPVPLVTRLRLHLPGLSWAAIADTGKPFGLAGTKLAGIMHSGDLGAAVASAASTWLYEHSQYGLYLLSSVLSDSRAGDHLCDLNGQIAENFDCLASQLQPPFTIRRPDAGPFAIIGTAGLRMSDDAFARHLYHHHKVLAVPVSWSASGSAWPAPAGIRVSLARDSATIAALPAAFSAAAEAVLGPRCPASGLTAGPG